MKLISVMLLSICLNVAFPVSAFTIPSFDIPSEYGMIKEESGYVAPGSGDKTIIYIQDVHCNYEAQKNIANILEYLIKKYGVNLVFVEGGSGYVGLSFLSTNQDKNAIEHIADRYLREGKISGEEYLDLVSDYNIQLYGIEDEWLYDEHLSAFERINNIRNQGLSYLELLENITDGLEPYIYDETLIWLEDQKENYEKGKITLAKYCQYLKESAGRKGISIQKFSNVIKFSELDLLDRRLDFNAAELQRNQFIKDLVVLLDEKDTGVLINKSKEFKSGRLAANEFYSFLKESASGKLNIASNYPQLDAYIKYVLLGGKISTTDILNEADALSELITEHFLSTEDQKQLSSISRSIKILKSFLNMALTPDDYRYFSENRSKFRTSDWINFLSKNCKEYNLSLYPYRSNIIDKNLEKMEEFYKLGKKREEAFMRNLSDKMETSGKEAAVLITGGFHTPGMSRMLKKLGYSYVVITPEVTHKGNSRVYFSVLKSEENRFYDTVIDEGDYTN